MTCRLMTSRKKYLCAPFAAIAMLATFLDFNMGEAHIPYIALDKHPSINNPLFIEDIQISRAIYQILNSSTPRSWIGFEAKAGEQLYFQVGIPALNELNDFRPSVFLYKPSQVEKNVGLDEKSFSKTLYMNFDQLKEMLDAGMHIGVHGYHHEFLGSLPQESQQFEIEKSLEFLKELSVDNKILTICYP